MSTRRQHFFTPMFGSTCSQNLRGVGFLGRELERNTHAYSALLPAEVPGRLHSQGRGFSRRPQCPDPGHLVTLLCILEARGPRGHAELDPHGDDSAKASRARTKAGDLRDTGIFLDLMHLKKRGGFDISLFYRDIISVAEDEDIGIHFEESSKLENLLRKVRAKETRKRVLYRLKLKLNKDVALTVGIYNMVQKAYRPSPVRLYRETNEPVKTKTRTFNVNTGSLLLPSDTKRSQIYGCRQIVLEKEETEELKRFDDPGLILIGFKPLMMMKKHHYLRPSLFVYPEESLINGSSALFSVLLTKCLEKEVMAVCRYTPRQNIPPCFVALVPQEEELDDQKIQVAPPGFQLFFLPYADDKRKVPFTEKVMANPEQVDKMKAIVQKLRFKYRCDGFENPVLQQHFRNMEALALDLMEP
ncbi:X-ray repair cross-complementing protein 6-like [Cervus elaphus]|uniref:X-ray repair cross-complementing protein 6-like n=1 Tax=Cervus elaphus TaxID=9860 RepID=UPI001CC320F2|nr:X-ray repair cross-complementing protein 6-like [Cervus elaphus]